MNTLKKIIGLFVVLVLLVSLSIYFLFPKTFSEIFIYAAYKSAGLEKKQLTASGHKIVYVEGGHGPTVVLLHGFAGNNTNWARFSKHLTQDYHIIAIDLPGFGESDRFLDQKYDIASQVVRLKAITKELGLKKFNLAGNSMGGHLAAAYTLNYPEDVASLALIAASGVKMPNKSEFILARERGKNLLLAKDVDDYDRVLSFLFVEPPAVPRPIKQYMAGLAVENRDFNNKVYRDLMENPLPLEPRLPTLQAPTFILWGDTDRVLDVSMVGVFESLIKNHKTVILPKVGHVPMLEKPAESAAYYQEFLAAHNAH